MPNFLNGKSKADRAPITKFILFSIIPFQIILLFFGVIFECQIAGSKPKKSSNLDLNSFVKKISGSKTKACLFLLIIFLILSKYTNVFPEPVVPCKTDTSNLLFTRSRYSNAFFCSLLSLYFFFFFINFVKALIHFFYEVIFVSYNHF